MKGAYMVMTTTDRHQFVFMVKLKESKKDHKSKVKKADCVVTLNIKQHEIVSSAFLNDQSIVTVQGTAFTLSKTISSLFSDSKVIPAISINGENNNLEDNKKTRN